MSRKKWSQPLMWGMIIAILNPLGVSYIALIGVVIGNTLTFVWCAMLAWAIYFYAIYLLCTRPHDSRLVQIYLLLSRSFSERSRFFCPIFLASRMITASMASRTSNASSSASVSHA
ncbi:hypothetical protein, partial [Klebsiella pneumoniae]|uniref:hypothetical protein n=1 Tax=Klebsiella pneumoniae TaxID=573 RepID=UPI001D18F628